MPKVLEDLRKKIAAGDPKLSKSSTYAIATAALQKQGKLPKAKPQNYCAGGKVISTRRV